MGNLTPQPTAKERLEQLINQQYRTYRKAKIERIIRFIDTMIEHEPLTARELAALGVWKSREILQLFNQLGLLEKVGDVLYCKSYWVGEVNAIQWKFANKYAIYDISEMLWDKLGEIESDE